MDDRKRHLPAVEKQFSQQAEAYSQMAVVQSTEIIQSVITISRVQKRGTVLDVTCGLGFLTLAFAENAARVIRVDITH